MRFWSQIRTVFIIDPKKIIRTMIQYPAAVGRDFDEVLRVIDGVFRVLSHCLSMTDVFALALQATDKFKVSTPVSWRPGADVIIPPHISDADAKQRFTKFDTVLVRHFLCFLPFIPLC